MKAVLITSTRRRMIAMSVVCTALVGALVAALLIRDAGSQQRHDGSVRLQHPSTAATSSSAAAQSTTPAPPEPAPSTSSAVALALPQLVRSNDPVAYARAVAKALFVEPQLNVSRGAYLTFWSHELPTVVYSDAAAKGLTLIAQNADAVDNLTTWWIPSQAVWNSEVGQDTVNRFTITSVSVPDYWVNAVADGTVRDPGLRMERVMGVLTQTYGTAGAPRATTSRPIVIDLGLLCGPTQAGGCRLLAPQQPSSGGE